MRIRKTLSLTLIVLGLLLATPGCSFSTPYTLLRLISSMLPHSTYMAEETPTAVPIPEATLTVNPQIYQVTRSEESEDGSYTIEIIHPELNNAGDAGENFNYIVEQLLLAQLEFFKSNVALLDPSAADMGPSTYHLDFTLYRQDSRFVSLLLIEDTYYAGAAHSGRQQYAYNYSLTESRFYELADLFLDGSPYIYALSEYSYQELSYNYGEDTLFSAGLERLPDNFARWNITPNGLLITFNEYQVLPYASGAPQVLIPYDLLEHYIDPSGPLGSYIPAEQLNF